MTPEEEILELRRLLLDVSNAAAFVLEEMLKGEWTDREFRFVCNDQCVAELRTVLSIAEVYSARQKL